MNSEELKLVEQLLSEETDIDRLMKLRKIICSNIEERKRINTKLDETQIEILLESFFEFSDGVVDNNRAKNAIARFFSNKYEIEAADIKVYHLVKLGAYQLSSVRGMSLDLLKPYEEELNKYNLTLKKQLNLKQLEVLERRERINLGGK